MSGRLADSSALAHLLPAEIVGEVAAIEPISTGLSGAGVYAVTTTRGQLVLRIHSVRADAAEWGQQLRVGRRAAERGVAPAIVHIDEGERAVVSARAAGKPLAAALADPGQRDAALAGVVDQLRSLHGIDPSGVESRNPLAFARRAHAAQRARPGFPAWADVLEPTFDRIGAILDRDPRRAVSHNDLNPGNVLWDGARAWLVDWEVAGLTHPLYDLATLAMLLQLDDAESEALLSRHEDRAIDDLTRDVFAALRRLVALLCGLVFAGLVPDLDVMPPEAPTLSSCHVGLSTGALDLRDPRGRATFALALLRLGVDAPWSLTRGRSRIR